MHSYEIIIVGAGPAGSSTAIELANLDPNLACRVLLLDKAVFPRPKLCAGGVTNNADVLLGQLGVPVELPAVPVHTSKFVFPTGVLTLTQESHFRVLRREEFDHYLFRAAKDRGVVTHEGEGVENVIVRSEGVIVRTSKGEYKSEIIIGADGANGTVHKLLSMRRPPGLMMAMEIHAPLSEIRIPGLNQNTAIFDFTMMNRDVLGYCWVFPAIDQRSPMFSLGIMDSSVNRDKQDSLKSVFLSWLGDIVPKWHSLELRAHPALRYEPRVTSSRYRALLVGDAAGVDPLLGEGITSALALGMIAAQSAYHALGSRNFCFSDHQNRVRSSFIGNLMRRRHIVARRFYGSCTSGTRPLQYSSLLDWVTPSIKRGASATATWDASSANSAFPPRVEQF